MSKPLVSIVMGSDSDLEIMREAGKALEGFGIPYEIDVTSAHRSPDRTAEYARGAAAHGSPACTPGTGINSFGPNAINLVSANSFTMYKVTVKDAGNFFVNWQGGNGFTAWDSKLFGPFEVSNTDGWDQRS